MSTDPDYVKQIFSHSLRRDTEVYPIKTNYITRNNWARSSLESKLTLHQEIAPNQQSADTSILQVDGWQNSKPIVFACIPALNEEKSIGNIILQTLKYVDKVFVCDDGSIDQTGNIAEDLGAIVIKHERNQGKGSALRDLFSAIQQFDPDVVVVLDADGQHNPKDIPRVIEPILKREAEIVVGSRYLKGSKTDAPLYRRIGLHLFTGNSKNGVQDVQSGLRAFSRSALTIVSKAKANNFGIETEQIFLAQKHRLRMSEIPVEIRYRGIVKPSKIHPIVHGAQIISTIIRLVTDEHPLLVLGVPSLILLVLSMISGLFLFYYFSYNKYFSLPFALSFVTCFIVGTLLGISALVLHALSRMRHQLE
jgi:glycosyltransferase involved in cell wall biosynthesis